MSTRMKKVLIGSLALVVFAVLTAGTLQKSNAQVRLLIDSPDFPGIPGFPSDCELHAFERMVACTNTYYAASNAYYTASYTCPISTGPTGCSTRCQSNPFGSDCTQCVNDCTSNLYNAYYQAERSLSTCGQCTAQLDFCGGARAAASNCLLDYQNCGGLFGEGCWETYSQCRLSSGIDQCQ